MKNTIKELSKKHKGQIIKPSVDTEVSMWNRGYNVGKIETIAEVEKLIEEVLPYEYWHIFKQKLQEMK